MGGTLAAVLDQEGHLRLDALLSGRTDRWKLVSWQHNRAVIPGCIKRVFCYNILTSGALWTLGKPGGSPPRAIQFPQNINLPSRVCFICKLTNPEPTHPTPFSSIWLSHSGQYPPALITPGSVPDNYSRPPLRRAHWSYSNQPVSACSPCFTPLQGNHNKASCPQFPTPSAPPWSFPTWPCMGVASPTSGTVTIIFFFVLQQSFQWQLSPVPDLLISPYVSNNKTYILKHRPGISPDIFPVREKLTFSV